MTKKRPDTPLSKPEYRLFYELSTALHAIQDLDEMLRLVLREIKKVLRIEGASIAIHDAATRELYFIHTIEEENKSTSGGHKEIRFPDHLGVAGWVLRENKTAVIPDVTKDERFYGGVDEKERRITRSMICVPLRTRKGTIGVLYALNKLEGTFTPSEGRLLEILSGTIAIAIENAKLYGELKQRATNLEQENRRLLQEIQDRFNIQGVIGSSPPMRKIYALISKVIDTPTSVLIQGETGTGKELIARVIHYSGPRKNKPFVAENCGALTETLLESELFGHVKGAFTGAMASKKGLFEQGHGGTVFLDELGETSTNMQVKLLRVLQEGQIRPVGGDRPIEVDVRIIASTNRDLEEEVRNGNFREDLFYRICVFPITMPPLRDRRSDVPFLAVHFLKKFSQAFNRPDIRISSQALDLMAGYDWPGNVREFENEIERAITLAGEDTEIQAHHLSEKITSSANPQICAPKLEGNLQEVVTQIERQMIIEALKKTNANRTQAAKMLGLTRQGLLNKINRYEIEK
jgi:Nif-specific regulatory protein